MSANHPTDTTTTLSQAELAALRARGHRLTPQRILILETLKAGGGHMTADQIHAQVAPRLPALNAATIYRTLQWLNGAGLVSVTDVGEGSLVYEYFGHTPHHHLICQRCHRVLEIDHALLTPLTHDLADRYGFSARFDHMAIFGECRECRQSNGGEEA
jgi:Fur family transcriptional regulator, ferric uptake regulator